MQIEIIGEAHRNSKGAVGYYQAPSGSSATKEGGSS